MSHEFVEASRRVYAAPFGQEESFAFLKAFATSNFQLQDRTLPEAGSELRGVEAMRAEVTQMTEAFEDVHYEIEDLLDLGDRIVVRVRGSAQGRRSGIRIDGTLGHVWTLRGGQAERFDVYGTWGEALNAVGLSQQAPGAGESRNRR
jgi:ketosteroid isomerase-like protein